MGLWDLFRRKNKEPEVIQNEKLSVEELGSWLINKKEEIKKQEEIFLKPIQARISHLTQDLEEEILVLKKVNVDEKKAEGKIKLIVKENLDNYIYYVEKLVLRLREMGKEKELVEKINSVFSDFQKKSAGSYEKATFLIGKEIAGVKESIRTFFKDLDRILKENQELTNKSKIIPLVEEKIEKFSKIKKIKSEIDKITLDYDNRIESLKKEIGIKKKKIGEIEKSEKFLQQEKEKEKLEKKKEKLEGDISKLRERIDFKFLANFFHSFEREMERVKAFKENFKENFQKTNGEELLSLIQESKLQDVEIIKKIEEIKERKQETENTVFSKTGVEDLESGIRKIRAQLGILNSKKTTERKKYEKLEKNLNNIISLLKEELIKINVEVF